MASLYANMMKDAMLEAFKMNHYGRLISSLKDMFPQF